MQVGDKVFVGQSWGFSGPQYTPGEVVKITPSGLVDVATGPTASITRFKKSRWSDTYREFGRRSGLWIDEEPYERRVELNGISVRTLAAFQALQKVETIMKAARYASKVEMQKEIQRLTEILAEAKRLTEAI